VFYVSFLVSLSVFSQDTMGSFFSNFLSFRTMCLGSLWQCGRRIPLVYGFWNWGFVGLGGV
jgi:hypothetical protein